MWKFSIIVLALCGITSSYVQKFQTKNFIVGIEYEHSLPMSGGSDRYRHRNNYDPFFVSVSAAAKNGYVISYLEVTTTVDEGAEVTFDVVRGQTGAKTMVFQLVSNHSDFLSYSYLCYGIREEEYKKINNIINIPMPNYEARIGLNLLTFALFIIIYPVLNLS